tara:strand:+ start:186 stop:800 length:615 start_codon:yes stop_codon:yes gene_type:complete
MAKHNGNYGACAKEVGMNRRAFTERVRRDPKLRAIWITPGDEGHQPTESELLVRKDPPPEPEGELLGALKKNGRDAFMADVESMLKSPDNIEKLKVFKDFDDSVGQLMGEALKVTQKIAIRQNMSLFEVAEKLRDDISDGGLDAEEEVLRTRLFIQATEQQGKFYDRLLHGLDLMLKLTEREKGSKSKKPGFRPLKEMEEVKDE